MKKLFLALTTVTCILCFSLVGCGGSSSNGSASYEDAFMGTWNAIEMTGELTYGKDQMEALRALGVIDVYLNFEKDGKAVLCSISGDQKSLAEGTWTADSATQATLTINGQSTGATLEEGLLSLPSGDGTIVFEKVDYREAVVPTTAADAGNSASNNASAAEDTPKSPESDSSQEAPSVSAAAPAEASSQGSPSSSSAAENASNAEFEASIDGVEVGSDYEGNPALIVTYTWKNNSEKTTSYASSLHAKCFQNGVQLDTAFVFDGIDSDGYMSEVRPGYGTTFQMAYELKDTENPVEIEVSELFSFNDEILVSKTFEL